MTSIDQWRSMVCNNVVTNGYRRSHRAWVRPLQWCSASGHPCVHYSCVVPAIIHVSITVCPCVHYSEAVPAKSLITIWCRQNTKSNTCPLQCVPVSITVRQCRQNHYPVPANGGVKAATWPVAQAIATGKKNIFPLIFCQLTGTADIFECRSTNVHK